MSRCLYGKPTRQVRSRQVRSRQVRSRQVRSRQVRSRQEVVGSLDEPSALIVFAVVEGQLDVRRDIMLRDQEGAPWQDPLGELKGRPVDEL